jgi:hypothetical protein
VQQTLNPRQLDDRSWRREPERDHPATYTALGDVASVDGPLSGSADTMTYRYDAARRRVGTIAPDPDGAGSLKRAASKITYDAAGRVTVTEAGTVAGTSDTDWAGFTSLQQLTSAYTAGLKTSDVLTASSTTYGVSQYRALSDQRGRC